MKLITNTYLIVVSALLPLITFAQPYRPGQGTYNPSGGNFGQSQGQGYYGQTRGFRLINFGDILALAQTLLGYIQIGIFVVAILFFLLAAFYFVKGDPGTGGNMLKWAAIGVIVGLLAFSIIPFLCWLTQSSGPACNL